MKKIRLMIKWCCVVFFLGLGILVYGKTAVLERFSFVEPCTSVDEAKAIAGTDVVGVRDQEKYSNYISINRDITNEALEGNYCLFFGFYRTTNLNNHAQPPLEDICHMSIEGNESIFFLVFYNPAARKTKERKGLANSYIIECLEEKETLLMSKEIAGKDFHLFSHGQPGQLLIDGQWCNAREGVQWLQDRQIDQAYDELYIYGCKYTLETSGKVAISYTDQVIGLRVVASDEEVNDAEYDQQGTESLLNWIADGQKDSDALSRIINTNLLKGKKNIDRFSKNSNC